MTEKTLNEVIRQLRQAYNYLNYAVELSDEMLHDHTVASNILLVRQNVERCAEKLDQDYRKSHFFRTKKRGR